jgi:nitroreductase/NAD-dependent dihydropyrimidine dehydrogenase PreA subunit
MSNFQNSSKIKIKDTLCNICGNCILVCPWHIFEYKDNKTIPQIVNQELCVSCGHCIAVCQSSAIIHSDFTQVDIKKVNKDNIPNYKQIIELFKSRRSIRTFKDKPIEKEVIKKIIEGACYAPSTNNIQSTEFTVIQNKAVINKIKDITIKYLARFVRLYNNPFIRYAIRFLYQEKTMRIQRLMKDYEAVILSSEKQKDLILHNAPALLFFHADSSIGFSDVNASLGLQNASLAVHSLGLGSFYAGYVVVAGKHNKQIKKLINIQRNHQIYGCLAFGYPKLNYKKWIERKRPKIEWI